MPLVADQLAIRVSGGYRKRDGYIVSSASGAPNTVTAHVQEEYFKVNAVLGFTTPNERSPPRSGAST
ncbi:hypothetical protein [Qipengyuania sediminis]|uniref:hypothetical protein n=1 Tax=Qipengyuania sediminis TaxID=1532023 RepID=UPI00105A1003|nr:hypothetical protein [Qipengyuania sediminis]